MSTETTTPPTMLQHREEHVALFIAEWPPGSAALVMRDAIEHGWGGASAEVAERLRALVDEARETIARRHPFPILARLEALVAELEDGIGA